MMDGQETLESMLKIWKDVLRNWNFECRCHGVEVSTTPRAGRYVLTTGEAEERHVLTRLDIHTTTPDLALSIEFHS
jgi:hypothetical protein